MDLSVPVVESRAWNDLIESQVRDAPRLEAVAATGLIGGDLEESFDRLTRLAGAILDVPWAFVTVVDDQRSFWKSCFGVNSTSADDRQNRVEESFCQYVVATKAPFLVGDARLDERTRTNPSIESMGVVAWAGYPLISAAGHVIGTFCVVDERPRDWSAHDIGVLETLAGAATSEIQLRTALDRATQTTAELALELAIRDEIVRRSQLLADLAQRLSAADSAEQIVRIMSTTGRDVLAAHFVNIAVLDSQGSHFRVMHSPSVREDIAERYSMIPLNEMTPAGSAVIRRLPVMASNFSEYAAQWPAVVDDAAATGLKAAAAIPLLRSDGSVSGALSIGWTTEVEFGPIIQAAISTVGQVCAQALERGQLGDARNGFLHALQQALLPRMPEITGLDIAARYLPANGELGFGGDWYDVFELSPTRSAVIVGDVCGHGIDAAATMALLRGSINALTRLSADHLDELFDRVEDTLSGDPDLVATVGVHIVDTATNQIDYVSAGHPPSVIVRSDGSHIVLEGGRRPVLGIGGDRPTVVRATFEPGATLVAYTDGLVERRGSSIDLGIAQMAQTIADSRHLPVGDVAQAVERSINASHGDDVAFAIVRHAAR